MNTITKIRILSAVLFLGFLGSSLQAATIRLVIEGVNPPYGTVYTTLFSDETDWLQKGLQLSKKTSDKVIVFVFEDVEPGTYALSAYHDSDDNGKLNSGAFGKPTEAYGFSNDARGMFGPAKWKDATIEVADEDVTLTIKIK